MDLDRNNSLISSSNISRMKVSSCIFFKEIRQIGHRSKDMDIQRKQVERSYLDVGKESDPYDLFIFAINAEQTREKYIMRLKKFLEIIGIDKEKKLTIQKRCKLFADKARSENGWLANIIIQFLQFQKERVNRKEITGSTLRNYVKVLKLFCEMNDLFVPWKKLTRGLPRSKNYADDRIPRLDEIRRIRSLTFD